MPRIPISEKRRRASFYDFRKYARRLLTFAALALAATAAVQSAPARQRTLLPVDEAARQPEFFSVRAGLLAAIARRDAQAVLAVVHPHIKNSFGGNDGIDAFRRMWRLDEPGASGGNMPGGGDPSAAPGPDGTDGIWAELGTVLALGGSFTRNDTFVAPYTFSRWPDEVDAFEHVVLIASNVRVRAAPADDAPVLRLASYEILQVARTRNAQPGWIAVQSTPGSVGYVAEALARSPIDYRAIFQREAGRWRLVTFVAGD